jgi:hypothetical protein
MPSRARPINCAANSTANHAPAISAALAPRDPAADRISGHRLWQKFLVLLKGIEKLQRELIADADR